MHWLNTGFVNLLLHAHVCMIFQRQFLRTAQVLFHCNELLPGGLCASSVGL
jgi:hypothetical protein